MLTVQALSAAAALDIGLRRYYGYTGERQALEVFTSNSLRVMVLPKGGA